MSLTHQLTSNIVARKFNLHLPHSHIAAHCWRHTVQAQFDGSKQSLNNIEPMSTACKRLQVLPPEPQFLSL